MKALRALDDAADAFLRRHGTSLLGDPLARAGRLGATSQREALRRFVLSCLALAVLAAAFAVAGLWDVVGLLAFLAAFFGFFAWYIPRHSPQASE